MHWHKLLHHKPLPHQVEAWRFAGEHHYSINGFLMGYGKSLVGIMTSIAFSSKTLVVSPAFLKRNWEKEFKKFCKKPLKIKVLFSKDLKTFKPSDEDVIIINYEILKNAKKLFAWADFVIADESHYLANPVAQRTMAFAEYVESQRPDRLLMLSGSPIRGKVPQWFAPLYIVSLNPKKTSGIDIRKTRVDSYWEFQRTFCHEKRIRLGTRTITKFEGLRNLDKLKKLLKDKYIRNVKSFSLKLPDLFEKEVEVDYENMDEDLLEAWKEYEDGKKVSDFISSTKKASALTKVPFTFNYVRNILDEGYGPLVVYSDHVQPVTDLTLMLKNKGLRAAAIHGAVPTDKRDQIVTDFQDGKLDVLVATIGAASTGITLTAANNLIFNDISWINTENSQAKKRIHRIGQNKECAIHYIIGSEIDKMITKTVNRKDEIMKLTVED